MKSPKFFLALLILFAAFQICFAQEKVKPEVFDSFGEVTCEDVLGRLDIFYVALRANPMATGYIVIHGNKNDKYKFRYERTIYGSIEFRRFYDSNLKIVRAGHLEESFIQFWLVQPGAEKPEYVETQPDLTIPVDKKPYIFNSTADDNFPCPSGSQLKLYSDYLTANREIRGHIVIFNESRNEFQKTKEALSNELINKYKIPPAQFRFFFVKSKEAVYNEFWLVPQKRRN